MEKISLDSFKNALKNLELVKYTGRVSQIIGLTIESIGPAIKIGEVCKIYTLKSQKIVLSEVVGFKDKKVLLMPLGKMEGIGPGSKVEATGFQLQVKVGECLLGRVLDGLGNTIDEKGHLPTMKTYPVNAAPPNPLHRTKITEPLSLGIKAIDGFITCGKGQRLGIFSGSGVGKSTLLGAIARNTQADVNVIALIGERGREVNEFLENDLKEEGLKKSVVIIATSDQPALVRMKGALLATSIAEYFRDQGKNVLLLMDSLTRFSMALREIGLAIGEPPVTKGYTPSVFAVLPKLLERSGTSKKGSITGLYTVLVDGDDMNDPIADAVRGILDGHIVLSRKLANKNHYPAIDILSSISRIMPNISSKEHVLNTNRIKEVLAEYKEAEDLINIGAYAKGSNSRIDYAIEKIDAINKLLKQDTNEKFSYDETVEIIKNIISE
ncbi:MAG: flagellar protein export ATPase FliI [Clostridiales bacterium]|nr:flagellar protein export ATPase FliI [Clostridiales bacterium]